MYGENTHPIEAEKHALEEMKHDGAKALDEDTFGERNPVNFHCLNSKFGSDFLNYLLAQGVKNVSSKIPVQ